MIDGPEVCAEFALEDPPPVLDPETAQGPQANPDSYAYFAMGMYYLEHFNIDFSTLTAQEVDEV